MVQRNSNKLDLDLLAQAFADVLTRRTGIQHVCRIRDKQEISNDQINTDSLVNNPTRKEAR